MGRHYGKRIVAVAFFLSVFLPTIPRLEAASSSRSKEMPQAQQTLPLTQQPPKTPSMRDTTEQKQRIEQARKEAEKAEMEYKKAQENVKKLEKFDKPAQLIQRGADVGVNMLSKETGLQGKGIEKLYKSTEQTIMDPERFEKAKEQGRKAAEQNQKNVETARERRRGIQEGAANNINQANEKLQKQLKKFTK